MLINNKSFKISYNQVIIAIFFIAFILRAYLSFTAKLGLDERFTYQISQDNTYIQHVITPPDDRPSILYLITKILLNVSDNYLFLRIPSLLFSLGALFILFKTLKTINKELAIYGLLFASLHPVLIHTSWPIRDYSILQFIGAGVIYYGVKILDALINKNKNITKYFKMLAIFCFFGVLTSFLFYPFMGSLFVSFFAIGIYKQKKEQVDWLKKQIKILVLSIIPIIIIGIYYSLINFNKVITNNQSFAPINSLIKLISELMSINTYSYLVKDNYLPIFIFIFFIWMIFNLNKYLKNKPNPILNFLSTWFVLLTSSFLVISNFLPAILLLRGWVIPALLICLIIPILIYTWIVFIKNKQVKNNVKIIVFIIILITGIFQYLARYNFIKDSEGYDFHHDSYFYSGLIIDSLIKNTTNLVDDKTQLILFPFWESVVFEYKENSVFEKQQLRLNNLLKNHLLNCSQLKTKLSDEEYKNTCLNLDKIYLLPEWQAVNSKHFVFAINQYIYENFNTWNETNFFQLLLELLDGCEQVKNYNTDFYLIIDCHYKDS